MESNSPFILTKEKSGFFLTAELEALAPTYGPLFGRYGMQPDGYNWERIAKKVLLEKAPSLVDQVEFKSEFAKFIVFCPKKKSAEKIQNVLSGVFSEMKVLEEWLKKSGIWFLKVDARSKFKSGHWSVTVAILALIGFQLFGLEAFPGLQTTIWGLIGGLHAYLALPILRSWKGSEDRPDLKNPDRFKSILGILFGILVFGIWNFMRPVPNTAYIAVLGMVLVLVIAEIYVIVVNGKL